MAGVVRVGVIGVGGVAVLRHLPAYKEAEALGAAELVAVYDADRNRAEAVAAEFGVPRVCAEESDLLEAPDIDAVSICTPNFLHHRQTLAALAAGKHVLCEKPLAMTLAEAREMEAVAARAGLVTAINFRYRWIPAALFVSDLIAHGALGTLYHGVFHYLNSMLVDPVTPVTWRTTRAQTGSGALGDLGSHLIDLAGSWLGEARRVRGELTTFVRERPTVGGATVAVDVDDAASFTIDYANGATGHFLATRYAAGRGNYQRIELYGTGGAVTYEFDKWDRGADRVNICLGNAQNRYGSFSSVQVSPEHLRGTPTGVMKEFLSAIRAGRKATPGFCEGLMCQEILTAIDQSAQEERPVALPLA